MITRHDIPQSTYYASNGNFPAVGTFAADGDHACLISNRWLLTAAHVAADLAPGATITMNDGQAFQIDLCILHPEFVDEPTRHDLALVRTRNPVSGIAPLPLYEGRDEAGQIVTFVGRGDFGTGLTGSTGNDGRLRISENLVDDVTQQWLRLRFDPPDSPRCLDLEGISGDGDSGGPALIRVGDGTWHLAGISSWQEDDGREGRYGVIEHYVRISSYRCWIASETK